jgi:hypothetical protein
VKLNFWLKVTHEEEKIKIHLTAKRFHGIFLSGEELFLTFQLTKRSRWLTCHRLIVAENKPGKLQEGKTQRLPLLVSFLETRH